VYCSNSYVTLRKAAIAGRGVALLPMRLVSDDLAEGTLVHVIPDIEVPDRPLYALHSPGTQTTARVRLFLDFVSEWFRKQAPHQQAPNQQAQQAKLAAVKSA
jgi:DNA-binding transcriptional LysR family regulator